MLNHFLTCAVLVFLAFPPAAADGKADAEKGMEIVRATWGKGMRTVDVTDKLAARIQDGCLTVTASNDLGPDPAPGEEKELRILYRVGGATRMQVVKQGEEATLPPAEGGARARRFLLAASIEGPIQYRAQVNAIRTIRAEALRRKADGVVIEIDTPGGRLDLAEEIYAEIRKIRPAPTIAWVRGQGAISAGVYVALACDRIVMSPGASIGASTPYMLKHGLPAAVEEKFLSAMRSAYGASAEASGRPAALAEAMVDPDIEVWEVRIGERSRYINQSAATPDDVARKVCVVSPAGKLLALTAEEAARRGFADAIAEKETDLVAAVLRLTPLGGEIGEGSTLDYRRSYEAQRILKEEVPLEIRAKRDEEERRRAREQRWKEQWNRLIAAEPVIRALDPRNFVYEVRPDDYRFTDGGKLWRERCDKFLQETAEAIELLEKLIKSVENAGDPAYADNLADMRDYLQRLRAVRAQIEAMRDMKKAPRPADAPAERR